MRETWMRPNTRVLWFAAAVSLLMATGGAVLVALLPASWWGQAGRAIAVALMAVGMCGLAGSVLGLRRPRLAYQDGHLLVYLGTRAATRVPIDIVECFFLGHGPSLVPGGQGEENDPSQTATVVVRLAERATQWHRRDVLPALGQWCDGYITIRGTWSEPITSDLVRGMNTKLIEVQRSRKQGSSSP